MSKNSYATNLQQRKDLQAHGGAKSQKPLPSIHNQKQGARVSPSKLDDPEWFKERIVSLESKSQQQEDQITVLNTALADVVRRLATVEAGATTNNTKGHSKPASRQKPVMITEQAATVAPVARAPRAREKAPVTQKTTPPKQDKVESDEPKSDEDKDFDEDEGYLKMYLRGRPIYMYAPTDVIDSYDSEDVLAAPDKNLQLDWVYGYRGRDGRSNLYYLASGEVVYFMAAVAVLYNVDKHTQRHYMEHNDDIKSLAVHPDRTTVATGQMAGHHETEGDASETESPHIRVWNSSSLQTINVIGLGDFERSVACIGFSKANDGKLLCAVDDSNNHVLSVWDWKNGRKITQQNCSTDLVLAVEFHPHNDDLILTCGKSALLYWTIEEDGSLDKSQGLFKSFDRPKWVLCMTFAENGDVVTGDSNGNILIWDQGSTKATEQVSNAHNGGVFSLCFLKNGTLVSGGGKDRKLVQWDQDFQRTGVKVEIPETYGPVRMITTGKGNTLLIGTTRNAIMSGTLEKNFTCVMAGHIDELWGLAVHPSQNQFLSCAYDEHVYLWDSHNHSSIWVKDTGHAAHSACFHPSGTVVAIGTTQAKFIVMDVDTGDTISIHSEGNEQIECIEYSPNGKLLALGSRDNKIYVYNVGENGRKHSKRGICSGHTSFVTHIDWAVGSDTLQSNSGDYELLYWDALKTKQLTRSSHLRDKEWYTQYCTINFNTRGIWPEDVDGTDINCCGRSSTQKLLASGDDSGFVNLYKYPCAQPKSLCHQYAGHSSHVTSVRFNHDDTRLFSAGGRDNAILQWKLS